MAFRIPSLFRRFRQSATATTPSTLFWTSVTATITAASLVYTKITSKTTSLDSNDAPRASSFQLNVDFMDRIASKPYLPVTKQRTIPKRLRLLAIDVPELREEGIDGECRVNLNKIFSDGIAPPKIIPDNDIEVIQKSLAHALVKCRHRDSLRIGVEVTEASVAHLNPHNLRKTHQFGSYKYDPGKYTTTKRTTMSTKEEDDSNDVMEQDGNEETVTSKEDQLKQQAASPNVKKDGPDGGTVLATEEDEYDAPWNQYAWIQELQLRIGGKVVFGEPMQASSRIQRLLFGNVYKATVPSCRAPWEYLLLLPMFQRNPEGTDAPNQKNWASNKPHAVIADGAAMQRVPGSLRLLQNTCQQYNVPLYIIHDPRVWGGNTHQALPEALSDMRRTIKQNIVLQAMRGGSSFSRGRMLGQAETEAKWQAKDMGRRTREAIREANEKLKRERELDWSQLDKEALQQLMVERKVIVLSEETKNESISLPEYTQGMVDLSRQCVADETERQNQKAEADAVTKGEASNEPAKVIAS